MPLSNNGGPARVPSRSAAADAFELWNRRAHYYIGLFLLWFVWLFAFTGLLLNHPNWAFAEFWPTRKQTSFERRITRPPAGTDLDQARNILRQLGVRGEIEWTSTRENSGRIDFRASRPGSIVEIKTDLDRGRAEVQRIDVNAWGVARILHTFTGVRAGDSRNQRDWILTTVWAWSMDATAVGLIIMVLGSYYMWWRLPRKRVPGIVALAFGWLLCALFAAGLRVLLFRGELAQNCL
jgi:hypothetical protein